VRSFEILKWIKCKP